MFFRFAACMCLTAPVERLGCWGGLLEEREEGEKGKEEEKQRVVVTLRCLSPAFASLYLALCSSSCSLLSPFISSCVSVMLFTFVWYIFLWRVTGNPTMDCKRYVVA